MRLAVATIALIGCAASRSGHGGDEKSDDELPDAAFGRRFAAAGFAVTAHSIGRGGRRHAVYVGQRA